MTWPHGDPNVVARGILAERAYAGIGHTTATPPPESIEQIVWEWLVDHVFRPLFHPLAHAFAASRGAATIIGFVLVIFALGLVAFVAFRVFAAFVRVSNARDGDGAHGSVPLDLRDASEWRAVARALAARGEYARAIAALFSAALAELDARALVGFDSSRTPGEYARLVRRAKVAAAPPFDVLCDRFVRALYAPNAPAAADYEAAERALAAFEPALAA